MRRFFFFLLAPLALCGQQITTAAEEFVLADKGRALAPIVLLPGAGQHQEELASELAEYLERIAGGKWEVTTGDGRRGIVLGTVEDFPLPQWRDRLAVRGHDGREAYAIRSEAERLLVVGATELGLDRAITRLLEELGCRWFFPSRRWHVVPRRERLAVALDVVDRPALVSRVIWWGWGYWDDQARRDHREWMRRNWLGESLKVHCGHAWQRIIAENRQLFERHPEYLAWHPGPPPARPAGPVIVESQPAENGPVEGWRGGDKFCISNPAVVELCRHYALSFFRRNPDADMVSMEPSDGGGHCQCPRCEAMGPIPERVHYLTNEVAKAVRARFPGKYVGTYAYHLHSEPPSFRMEPNVYVQITAGFTRGRYSFLELIDVWPDHVNQFGIYEYFNVWAWWRDMPGRPRGADLSYLAERIPYYIERGATTMSCESGSNYGVNGLGYLVASRLMWNPKADVEAICRDFYQKAFGPAAEPMRRYYERFDPGNRPLVSDHLLALADRDVARASELAADRPDVLQRLDDIKLYLHYVRLMRELEVTRGPDARLAALFPVLNFAYRTRHRYIVNSPAIRGRYATYYLAGIKQPDDWDYGKMQGKPAWCTGGEYTGEEVEALFQDGLRRFRPQEFPRRHFSNKLVWAGLPARPGSGAATFRFQGPETFLLASLDGQPLRFRLLTGYIAHYRDRRPTEWQLFTEDNRRIAGGQLPLDGQWHALRIAVPHAGIYRLEIEDFAAGWQIDYPPGRPYVWQLEKGRRAYSLGNTGYLYFYVPKGTRQVAYHVEGSAHRVLDGAGNEVASIDRQPGNVIVLPVAGGQDGQAWCLEGLRRTHLWFYNCPNLIAAHPEDVLVPQELKRSGAN